MNPIEKLIELINSLLVCTALAADDTRLNNQDYLVQHWTCQTSAVRALHIEGWRQWCDTNGYHYMGRPFYLKFDELHTVYYMGRFGDVMSGEGAYITDAYHPPCGS